MKVVSISLVVALALPLAACAGDPSAKSPESDVAILPLKSVRLYEAGVGYFEREGTTSGRTSLPVPPGHLDDALETLVVLSRGGKAEVTGVAFPTSITKGMARALAGLPASEEGPLGFRSLLGTMRGAHVVVRTKNGNEVAGRLVDVADAPDGHPQPTESTKEKSQGEKKDEPPRTFPGARLVAVVLADSGDVMRFHEDDLVAVRPTDPAFAARLGTALDAVSTQGARKPRLMEVLGSGSEPVTLGYLAEAPIWRTTYRLVLGEDDHALLQGWALLHNDTDESWRNVHVELVNGQPDSFLFPLAAPRYARRELKTPDNTASTVPQLFDNSADRMWGDHAEDALGAGGLGLSGVGEGGGGRGEGIGLGSIGTVGHGSGSGSGYGYGSGSGSITSTGASSLLEIGNLARTAQAEAVEGGALFRYVLKAELDLAAHSSALVPFVSVPVASSAVTIVNGAEVRAGVRFVNQTKQTLPPGVVSFFSDGGFAGQSALPRLRPGEHRLVTFGNDLDVDVTVKSQKAQDATQRVVFRAPSLEEHYLRTSTADYVVKNDAGKPRHVAIALHIANNARVDGADRVDYDASQSLPLAIVDVSPKRTVSRNLTTKEGLVRRTTVEGLDAAKLEKLSRETAMSAFEKQVLADAALKAKPLVDARAARKKAQDDVLRAEADLGKLRENLKTLTTEKDKTHPFVTRVVAAEDALARQKLALEALAKDEKKATEELTKILDKLAPAP